MQRHDNLISHVLNVLNTNPIVKNIYLFGSCARCEESWSSDVDLLVVVDDSATDTGLRQISTECVPENYRAPELDIVIYREASLRSESFFLDCIRKDWRLLYENVL